MRYAAHHVLSAVYVQQSAFLKISAIYPAELMLLLAKLHILFHMCSYIWLLNHTKSWVGRSGIDQAALMSIDLQAHAVSSMSS